MGKSKSGKRATNSAKGFDSAAGDMEEGGDRPGWPKVILSLAMGESVMFRADTLGHILVVVQIIYRQTRT